MPENSPVSPVPPAGYDRVIGQVFGDVTVIGFDLFAFGVNFFKCRCSCGAIFVENLAALKTRRRVKCPKCRPQKLRLPDKGAMIGRTYGSLTVVRRLSNYGNGSCYLCFCDCVNWTLAHETNLRSGRTRSCGCSPKGRKPKAY